MPRGSEVLPICRTCAMQYTAPRGHCPVCDDERQYVHPDGQQWTTLEALRAEGHRARVAEEGPGVVGIGTEPAIGIGQRALLVRAPSGNVLWDCIGYLDDELVRQVTELGGIAAIAVSHPHFYGAVIEWSRAFDAPVYLHAADREWVGRPDPAIVHWAGDTCQLAPDLTLINAGTHFAGGTVLHWRDAHAGAGALFSGDIVAVVADTGWVSFMYSFPNHIPERPRVIRRALRLLEPFDFDRIYGAFWGRVVTTDATAALDRSARRYLRFALDDGPPG